jgi:hypothetical protein
MYLKKSPCKDCPDRRVSKKLSGPYTYYSRLLCLKTCKKIPKIQNTIRKPDKDDILTVSDPGPHILHIDL